MKQVTEIRKQIIFFGIFLISNSASYSQSNADLIRVPLSLNKFYNPSGINQTAVFDSIHLPGPRVARLSNKLFKLVKADSFHIRVIADENGDGSFENDKAYKIEKDSIVFINYRKGKTDSLTLTYMLKWGPAFYRDAKENKILAAENKIQLTLTPAYSASGYLAIGKPRHKLWVLDINADGLFNRKDFRAGTSLLINFKDDTDPKKGEWLFGSQIINFHDTPLIIDSLDENGSFIIFRKSSKAPVVGDELPFISVKDIKGNPVYFNFLKGKFHLIDFWASWCKPCLAKFPMVKEIADEHKNKLSVITVNFDDANRIPQAKRIITSLDSNWQHITQAKGQDDVLWKLFGGTKKDGNYLVLPIYVLADEKGVIRYIGDGGNENLNELKKTIALLIK